MHDRRRQRDSSSAIASFANEQVRYVKSLYRANVRRKEHLFVVEGVRLLEDALQAGARPELVLLSPDQLGRTPRGATLLERLADYHCLTATDPVLKSISDTETPQGVIAVFPIPPVPAAVAVGPVVLVLDGLRDPGNAGTILRSADASGMVRTVIFVDSVDAYAPKVVRAGMGAHFRLAILEDVQWSWLRTRLADRSTYLATSAGGEPYDQIDWTRDCALILGGEADGAGDEAQTAATRRISIPMSGPTESLNAAMAGTVLLFAAARARLASTRPAQVAVRPTLSPPRPSAEASRSTKPPSAPMRGRREEPGGPSTGAPPRGKPDPSRRQPGSWHGQNRTSDKKRSDPESRPTGPSGPKPADRSPRTTRRRPKL